MLSFVLDTNLFINLQRPLEIGGSIGAVLKEIIALSSPLVKAQKIEIITSPSALEELSAFYSAEDSTLLLELKKILTVTSPDLTTTQTSAVLFYDLVKEIGVRLYKGLRVAEEPLKQAIMNPSDDHRALAEKYVTDLRLKYRKATREGFIDSTIDLELIYLALNKKAAIVTSDKGLISWGRRFGCTEVLPEVFIQKLQALKS
jgi:hypothetical protein